MWRLRLAQFCECLAQVWQMLRADAEPPSHALARAEQIKEDGHLRDRAVRLDRLFEQQCRAARMKHAPVNLRHFVNDRDRFADADKLAFLLKAGEKVAQIGEERLVAA